MISAMTLRAMRAAERRELVREAMHSVCHAHPCTMSMDTFDAFVDAICESLNEHGEGQGDSPYPPRERGYR